MGSLTDYFNYSGEFFRPITIQVPETSHGSSNNTLLHLATTPPSENYSGVENGSVINSSDDSVLANETLHQPLAMEIGEQVALTFAYSLIMFLSVAGNIIVILVFSIGRRSRSDIRIFLINLAVSDLILAIFCMPFSFAPVMLGTWSFADPLCTVVSFMQLFSVTASVLTNMAIGIDRFIAVSFPLRSMTSTKYRSKIILGIIWSTALVLAGVQLFVARVRVIEGTTIKSCEEAWADPGQRQAFTLFVLAFTYIIPFIILTVTYSIIARNLWTRTSPGNRDEARDAAQLRSKRRVVKMLVIILALFGLCWLPLHVFFLLLDHTEVGTTTDQNVLKTIYIIVHIVAMSNSFQNPIIYGFMNNQFRADLCDIIVRWFPCCSYIACVTKARARASRRQNSQYSRASNNNVHNSDNSDGSNTPCTNTTSVPEKKQKLKRLGTNYGQKNDPTALKPLMNGHGRETNGVAITRGSAKTCV